MPFDFFRLSQNKNGLKRKVGHADCLLVGTKGVFMVKTRINPSIVQYSFSTLIALVITFICSWAPAQSRCSEIDSPESVAQKYQLFSAFQTGYDGYQVVCENKCFGKKSCEENCQSKKALEYLSKQMNQLVKKSGGLHCPSLTLVCLEQCTHLGVQCAQVCSTTDSVAQNH